MTSLSIAAAGTLAICLTLGHCARCGDEAERSPPLQSEATPQRTSPSAVADAIADAPLSPEALTRQLDEIVGGRGAQLEAVVGQLDGKPWAVASAELSMRYEPPVVSQDGARTWADPDQYGMICTMVVGTDDGGVAHLVAETTTDPGPGVEDPRFTRCARAKVHARGL